MIWLGILHGLNGCLGELGDGSGMIRKLIKEIDISIAIVHIVGNIVLRVFIVLMFRSSLDSCRVDA